MKYLKDTIPVKGFLKGLITDGNEGQRFPDSVVDCLNVDFLPHATRRRMPYIMSQDLNTLLASKSITEYEVVNFYQKTFYNSNGLSKSCIVFVINEFDDAEHIPDNFVRTRIFIKGYYEPAPGYDNSLYGNATRAKGILTPVQLTDEYAEAELTSSQNFEDGDTIEIEDITHGATITYTFKDELSGGGNPYEVLIGGTLGISLNNLAYAINYFQSEINEGVNYGAGTQAHPDVYCYYVWGAKLNIRAIVTGSGGNAIAVDSSPAYAEWDNATLTGGVDMVNFTNGETITIGTKTYTFKDTLASAYDVLIGSSTIYSLIYLVDALVDNSAYEGSHYGTGTAANTDVIPTIDYVTGIINLEAQVLGESGNSVVTTETSAAVGFGGTTLSGGSGEETGDEAFVDDLIELTETIPEGEISSEEFSESGWAGYETYNYRVLKTNFGGSIYSNNYYKGWFVHDASEFWGFVEASGSDTNYVYFKINYANHTGHYLGLSRFAVGFEGMDIFTSKKEDDTLRDYTFSEFPNGLKIYPEGERILNINFIKDRININILTFSEVTHSEAHTLVSSYSYFDDKITEYIVTFYKTTKIDDSWNIGVYLTKTGEGGFTLRQLASFRADESESIVGSGVGILLKETVITDDGKLTLVFNSSITVADIVNLETASFFISFQATNKWDGFYFDYDCPKILSKKNYYLIETGFTTPYHGHATKELGIWFALDSSGKVSGKNVFYSYVVQIDGYQDLFIFNAVSIEGDLRQVGIKFYLEPWFNRRITAFKQAFSQEETTKFETQPTKDNEIPATYLLDENAKGTIKLIKAGSKFDLILNQYYIDGIASSNTHTDLVSWATDIGLQQLLNQYYWKEVSMKCTGGTELGDGNTLVYGIKDDIIRSENNDSKITGELSIAISNKQSGAINTDSIFGSERFKEVAKSKIIEVVVLSGYQFLVFTKDSCKWLEVDTSGSNNFEDCILKEHGTFEGYGALSRSGIVRIAYKKSASMGTASWEFGAMEFYGVAVANEETIRMFIKNEFVDLLYDEKNRISILREYYQSLDKDGMISGYNPCRKEIIFYIDGKLLVYSIINRNWTIHTYGDIPKIFSRDEDGRITFTDGQDIYRTTEYYENIYLDKETDGIPFYIKYLRNHESNLYKKIPDRIEINVEHTPVYNMGEPLECPIDVVIYKENTLQELLNKQYDCNYNSLKAYKNGSNRIAVKYYTVKIASVSGKEGNFEKFQINEIKNKAKILTGRKAGKI